MGTACGPPNSMTESNTKRSRKKRSQSRDLAGAGHACGYLHAWPSRLCSACAAAIAPHPPNPPNYPPTTITTTGPLPHLVAALVVRRHGGQQALHHLGGALGKHPPGGGAVAVALHNGAHALEHGAEVEAVHDLQAGARCVRAGAGYRGVEFSGWGEMQRSLASSKVRCSMRACMHACSVTQGMGHPAAGLLTWQVSLAGPWLWMVSCLHSAQPVASTDARSTGSPTRPLST